MSRKFGEKIQKKYIAVYLYMIIILLTLLTVASYTWFSLSQTPRVSDLYMFVNAETGMEVALDPALDEWGLQLDFRDMVDVTTPLRPVTWSEKDQRFYAAVYGIDGRLTDRWEPLNDQRHANKDNLDGYYIKAVFYARSDLNLDVDLSPAVEVDKGINGSGTYLIGQPEWDAEGILHNNGGLGGECAVRIGFRTIPVDATGQPVGERSDLIIYEPNSNSHPDRTVGYIPTPSIDGTETLVPEERMILQSYSTWTEADPVQRNVVVHQLGEFLGQTRVFHMVAGEILQVEMYIWLEGQDVDCTNKINKAQILASVQFATEPGTQSGLTPIDQLDTTESSEQLDRDDVSEENGESNRDDDSSVH